MLLRPKMFSPSNSEMSLSCPHSGMECEGSSRPFSKKVLTGILKGNYTFVLIYRALNIAPPHEPLSIS